MGKYTQYQIILNTLREANNWVASFNLEKVSTKWGYLGASGSRRCRELAEAGKILRKQEGKYVWYRSKETAQKYNILDALGNPYKQV